MPLYSYDGGSFLPRLFIVNIFSEHSEIPEQLIIDNTFNEPKLICQYLKKYNLILIKSLMLQICLYMEKVYLNLLQLASYIYN